ncbi:hypothetical protein P389DRAFT_167259 [Cystobasidium minutum MCA 4210]|uniref:uncharacterized protein n=1 Tax=Cystobasidium minutum MCA 4210 TaxID=1397322 RepID=UPI0034CD4287|eukprot:jgi/Rhomi1/167259/fgenesh1_kg.2_\
MSSRPDSPASPAVKSVDRYGSARSSFDLERSTSDMGWVEWGRRRLSSMTSSTSLVDSAEGGRSIADQIAEKIAASAARGSAVLIANRGRRKSESAATALGSSQFEDATSEIQAIATPASNEPPATADNIGARSLAGASSRPRSTLSLSSTSSLDTDASLGRSTNTSSAPVAGRSQFRNSLAGPPSSYSSHPSNLSRSRRFRKELRSANLGPSMALPQLQLDTASASALNTSPSSSSSSVSYSHRPSSLHLDTGYNPGFGSTGFYSSYSLSHSTSRLGTTPFSPIHEVAPPLQTYTSSPEHVLGTHMPSTALGEDSVPPTPRDYASATVHAPSQPLA